MFVIIISSIFILFCSFIVKMLLIIPAALVLSKLRFHPKRHSFPGKGRTLYIIPVLKVSYKFLTLINSKLWGLLLNTEATKEVILIIIIGDVYSIIQ